MQERPIGQQDSQQANQSMPTSLDSKLVKEGFPENVSKAFQQAADQLNCVIWSRVPGKACTTLIDEGYNLKPFYVHGKSCNWEPMAGFVCHLPGLNKAGASKIAYNLKEHINSLKWLGEKQKKAVSDWDAQNSTKQGVDIKQKYREMRVADSLFLSLSISDKRKQELLNSGFLPNHKIIDDDLIYGIAQDKDKTVAIEYLIKKQSATSNLWNIYHRNIYIKDSNDRYVSHLKKNGKKFSIDQEDASERNDKIQGTYNDKIQGSIIFENLNETEKNQIDQGLREIGIVPGEDKPLDEFYAVNGIQSPYLAYIDDENLYKNAVSGDYDLFAVWPFTPNVSFEMTTRISERVSKPSDPKKSQNLFIPVEAKTNAVEFTKARNVFIEFIGTYQELDGKEDPELGNINELVSLTAQTLNSLVRSISLGEKEPEDKGQFPNRAFHSDEGGRPGVKDIDYPIAFFMPKSKSLWDDLKEKESSLIGDGLIKEGILKSTAFVVENHVEFLALIQLLRKRFYIFLHDGWVMHLMCLAAGKEKLEDLLNNEVSADDEMLLDKSRKYFEARSKEIDDLGDSFKSIDVQLRKLLTSRPVSATNDAFSDVTNSFIKIARSSDLSAEK